MRRARASLRRLLTFLVRQRASQLTAQSLQPTLLLKSPTAEGDGEVRSRAFF